MNSFDFSLVEEQDPSVGERARGHRPQQPLPASRAQTAAGARTSDLRV
jgi:hypothetical protein